VRIVGAVGVAALLTLLAGCGTPEPGSGKPAVQVKPAADGPVFLTVDFATGQVLRYKFTSQKKIAVDWDPNAAASANRVQEQSESLEMVVAYTPLEVDPNGVRTIRAAVESVQARRTGGPASRSFGTDAVESAQGEGFTLKVDSHGKIVDSSQLRFLIQEMGKHAFRPGASAGRIKEPDMIWDFIASQWFLWDAEASVPMPAEGVAVGQTWSSQLCVPAPMVMRKARNVVYKLEEVRPSEAGPLAVIKSTYSPAASAPAGWPIPYSGRMQMSGTFGFLLSYEVLGLDGTGEELFNLKAGRIEQRRETYTLRVKAGLPPMGIKANPQITIEQMLTMELMKPEIRDSNIETRNKSEGPKS
jgi:hypothetical protein